MPHVDEFFAPAMLAAAGLAVAIALQPATPAAADRPTAAPVAAVASTARPQANPAVVRLPTVEVVARRGDGLEIASRERQPRPGAKPAA